MTTLSEHTHTAMTHEEIKAEVLAAAKSASACADQYRRAEAATTHEELSAVMRENFQWLISNGVLTGETIDRWKPVGIVHNQDVSDGYCYASGHSTVRAYGSSTVRAYDSSTVRAYDSSAVRAYGSSAVRAYDSSTVRAYDSSAVRAYGSSYINHWSAIEATLSDKAIARVKDAHLLLSNGTKIDLP